MQSVVPKSETRFWGIFRCLLLPVGLISLLLCIVLAVVTAMGANTPVINGHEVPGLSGALICLAAFPFITLLGASGFAAALYFERMKVKRQK